MGAGHARIPSDGNSGDCAHGPVSASRFRPRQTPPGASGELFCRILRFPAGLERFSARRTGMEAAVDTRPPALRTLTLAPAAAPWRFDVQGFSGLNRESRLRRPSPAVAAGPAGSTLQSVRPTLMPVRENRHIRGIQKLQLAHYAV